jgi:hypothetical protein
MRHPDGGGEGGVHHGFLRSSSGSVRHASIRPVAGRGFSANENGRRVRPPRFRGDPVSQTSPWGRGAAPTAWDATPVSCANSNRAPRPPSRGVMATHRWRELPAGLRDRAIGGQVDRSSPPSDHLPSCPGTASPSRR